MDFLTSLAAAVALTFATATPAAPASADVTQLDVTPNADGSTSIVLCVAQPLPSIQPVNPAAAHTALFFDSLDTLTGGAALNLCYEGESSRPTN